MADRNIATVDLDRAVEAGVIDRETADSLAAFASKGATPLASGERFRIVSTFADVFLAIGLAMLTGGLAGRAQFWSSSPVIEAVIFAGVTWALAEHVVRKKRMVLPGMVLATAFAVLISIAAAKSPIFSWLMPGASPNDYARSALTGAAAAIGGGVFFLRFRFPFSLAVVVAGFATMAIIGIDVMGIASSGQQGTRWASLICGLLAFVAAMTFDMREPRRERWAADCGFWLHVAAAPLLVHAIFAQHLQRDSGASAAAWTLSGLLLLTVVSLVIDRRALIVSALTYAGGFVLYAMDKALYTGHGLSVVLAVLGVLVVVLGLAWIPLRRLALRILPLGPLARRLPPVIQTA